MDVRDFFELGRDGSGELVGELFISRVGFGWDYGQFISKS
jgi:hypothetical protein